MLTEFKAFIARGNVLDFAVAVIIGAAFATIATSLTQDIIMPVIGSIFGGLNFSSYFILLGPVPEGYAGAATDYAALKKAGAPVLGYGQFLTVALNFLILAFIVFLLIRAANRMIRRADVIALDTAPDTAPDTAEVELLREIRDELKARP